MPKRMKATITALPGTAAGIGVWLCQRRARPGVAHRRHGGRGLHCGASLCCLITALNGFPENDFPGCGYRGQRPLKYVQTHAHAGALHYVSEELRNTSCTCLTVYLSPIPVVCIWHLFVQSAALPLLSRRPSPPSCPRSL